MGGGRMGKAKRLTPRLGAFFIASYAAACGGDALRAHSAIAPRAATHAGAVVVAKAPAMHVVLNDPRLRAARDYQIARDFAAAARVVDDERGKDGLDPAATCAWAYVSGRLHLLANEAPLAATSFDAAMAPTCPLAPYAALRSAEAYAKAGSWQTSLARAQAVPESITLHDEARITLAEALAGNGQRLQAVAIWRELLTKHPHGTRWVDTAVRLATALLDGVDGDPTAHAKQAYDLATRVVIEAPKVADGSGATAQRARAFALLRAADPSFSDALSDGELARRTQGWLDAGDANRAVSEFDKTVRARPGGEAKLGCKALVAKSLAVMRTRSLSADSWGSAITACDSDDELAVALFQGGKASVSAKRNGDAISRFEELEDRFPHHRLADDGSLRAAMVYLDEGEVTKGEEKLLAIPDKYPDGDMASEALFRVALARMARDDWRGAIGPLDRAVQLEGDAAKGTNAGRAAYFRARAADVTGDHEGAVARYAHVVETHPLTFFMLAATSRLASIDANQAKTTLARATANDVKNPPVLAIPTELFGDRAGRARALLEVGEVDAAKQELAPLTSDPAATFDLSCALGAMFEDAGAYDVGSGTVHSKDFATHYPVGTWRRAWEIAFPQAFLPYVQRETTADAVPMTLVYGIMREESRYFPDARSPANAFGLMQMIPPTAKVVAQGTNLPSDEASLTRADVSIALGTRMLGQLRASSPQNPHLAIPSYNAGPRAVQRWIAERPTEDFDLWIEQIPFEETRNYIKKVLASQATYAFLYEPSALPPLLALPNKVSGTP